MNKLPTLIIIDSVLKIENVQVVENFFPEKNRKFNLLKALSALRNTFSLWRSRFALDFLYTFQ